MKKIFLIINFILLLSSTGLCQEQKNYSYSTIFTELRHYLNKPKDYGAFNFGYQGIRPLKLKGEKHKNLRNGLEIHFALTLADGAVLNRPDILSFRVSYVFGYEYAVSSQFTVIGNIKPSYVYTGVYTLKKDPITQRTVEDNINNHDIAALLGVNARYFFSENGKFGVSAELFTSLRGGTGFNSGLTWRM